MVALAAAPGFAGAAAKPDVDAAPAGLTPTTATLDAVLEKYKQAIGRAAVPIKTRVEEDAVSKFGQTGTVLQVESGKDFRVTTRLGRILTGEGARHGRHWWQDENGYTVILSGVHHADTISDQAMLRALRKEQEPGVKLVGEVSSPVSAYVVEVHPPDGRHEWLFFDKQSGQIVRSESVVVEQRWVSTFDDFRTTDGITEPWHGHDSSGQPANEIDWRITKLAVNQPVASADLEIPPNRRTVVQFPAGKTVVSLPARIEDGVIIVRAYINGRGLDFQLDSGASSIVIDRQVVRELGLATFGQRTETVAGTFESSQALVPAMTLGDLKMDNLVVDSLPFNQQWDPQTKIVGLLGFDFLAGAMTKIDYVNGQVTAYEPSQTFIPPGQSFTVPAALDDGIPKVGAQVGQAVGENFIVDTGAADVIVFSGFAQAHSADVADVGLGKELTRAFPFVHKLNGVGGSLSMAPTQVAAFHFAGVNFQNFLLFVTRATSGFGGEDSDGLVGYRFLRFFDVYLDYRNSRVMLAPNNLLIRASGASK